MNGTATLLARVQEILDTRRDPFEDQALCEALADDVAAMQEAVELRALHLELDAAARGVAGKTSQSGDTGRRRGIPTWSWIGLPAAAALLLWMTSERPIPTEEDAGMTAATTVTATLPIAEPLAPGSAAPAILKVRENIRTTTTPQRPQGDLLHVRITTTEHSTQT